MAGERHGPFDRILKRQSGGGPETPDRAMIYVGGVIVGLAILLLVLVLPPISILSGGGGDDDVPEGPGDADTYTSTVRSSMPGPPDGLSAASAMFDLSAPEDQRGASGITVPLKETETDARSLGLYTYAGEEWERVSDVTLVAGGTAARGEVQTLPGNVAVFRRIEETVQIAGLLPAGAALDESAGTVITTLHPLVFLPTADGSIVGDAPVAPPAGYNIVPSIVAPNPDVVDEILRSTELRERHASEIAAAANAGNYAGMNVDYRSVNPQLREQFTQFVQSLSTALHEGDRTLTLTLPAPVTDGDEMDTGGYDWEALGASSDFIEIAAELDQELYFQRTEAALDYVVERVEPAKLLLTIPATSVERGSDGLRTLPLEEAMAIASTIGVQTEGAIATGAAVPLLAQNLATSEGASGITWDGVARAVTYSYPGRGGKRTVWIANRFSSSFRLELAQRYGLGGVVVTDVSTTSGGADVLVPIRQFADTSDLDLVTPNGDLFAPGWTATTGTLSATSGDSVAWTAPAEPGAGEVTLIVSDGVIRVGQRVTLDVVAAAE